MMVASERTPVTPRVLVLGGAGFIGRHAVASLCRAGASVTIASRYPARHAGAGLEQALAYDKLPLRFERLTSAADWQPLLASFDAVLNCVGILRQRGRETYERVHHLAPAALAQACGRDGLLLVHVSALGLHDGARSRFLASKLRGERALRASGARICIVRPSLLDGDGGFGARWLRALARMPLRLSPRSATGRVAALDVRDLADALAALVLQPPAEPFAEIELGGSATRTLDQHVAALRRCHTMQPALCLAVPNWLARLASHLCDALALSPFSFGHWELLQHDNLPCPNALPALIGRAPREVGVVDASALAPISQLQKGIRVWPFKRL